MCIWRPVIRTVVVGALVGGGLLMAAEAVRPGAAGAIVTQTKDRIGNLVDRHVDDPIALRESVKELAAEYPQRIATVSQDLDTVRSQINEVDRKLAESQLVVRLTQTDINRLDAQIARASKSTGFEVRPVSFRDERIGLERAAAERRSIETTRQSYASLAQQLEQEVGFLEKQEHQLAELLATLESEYAAFQGELFALDVQIDAIARNDRLIRSAEERQARIDEVSRYEVHSLQQVRDRVTAIRTTQQNRIERLTGTDRERRYVDVARMLIDSGVAVGQDADVHTDEDQWPVEDDDEDDHTTLGAR